MAKKKEAGSGWLRRVEARQSRVGSKRLRQQNHPTSSAACSTSRAQISRLHPQLGLGAFCWPSSIRFASAPTYRQLFAVPPAAGHFQARPASTKPANRLPFSKPKKASAAALRKSKSSPKKPKPSAPAKHHDASKPSASGISRALDPAEPKLTPVPISANTTRTKEASQIIARVRHSITQIRAEGKLAGKFAHELHIQWLSKKDPLGQCIGRIKSSLHSLRIVSVSTQRRLRQLVSLKLENLPLPDEPLLRLQAAYSALESEQRIASQLVAELLDLTDFREQESRSITTTRPPALDKEEHDIPNKLSLLRSAKRKLRSVQKQSQSLEFLLERLYFDHIGETLAGFRIEGTRAAQLADELFQLQQSHFQASADSSPNDSSQVSIADASTPGLEAAPGTDPQSASTLASFVTIAFGSIRQTLQFLTARLGSTASTLLRTGNLLRSISKHGDAQADMPVPVTMTKKNGADKTAGQVKAGSNWKALKKSLGGDSSSSSVASKKRKLSDRAESTKDPQSRVRDIDSPPSRGGTGSPAPTTLPWFADDLSPEDLALVKATASSSNVSGQWEGMSAGDADVAEKKRRILGGLPDGTSAEKKEPGTYLAIDCEMVGVGANGSESILARVSIVNWHGATLLDRFVRPLERVTDYRTWVSGVRPKDLRNAPTFVEVQREVAAMIKGRVLVGHAIQNDLKALLLSHPRTLIRDTATFKPLRDLARTKHPALRTLTKLVLGIEIQQPGEEHSSVEDARATMAVFRTQKDAWEASLGHKLPKGKRRKTDNGQAQGQEEDDEDEGGLVGAGQAGESGLDANVDAAGQKVEGSMRKQVAQGAVKGKTASRAAVASTGGGGRRKAPAQAGWWKEL